MRRFLIGIMIVNVLLRLGNSAFVQPTTFVDFYTAVLLAGLGVFWWLYPPLLNARAQLLAESVHIPNIGPLGPSTQRSDTHPDAGLYQSQPKSPYSPPHI